MTLFMIRHGQTTANLDGIYSGQSDVKLTALGRQQAEAIRPILSKYCFDKIYSSDLSRAAETARLALPGCEPIQLPLLRELSIGDLTGESIASVRERYGNLNGNFAAFHGEDPQMIGHRARQFLTLLENDPASRIAAFTHNGYMKAVLRQILGEQTRTASISNGNCNIAVLEWDGRQWKLLAWNYGKEI